MRSASLADLAHLQVIHNSGAPKRAIVCAECDFTEIVVCDPDRPGQALSKVGSNGWRVRGERCVCPTCVAASRAARPTPVPSVEQEPEVMANPAPLSVVTSAAEATPREPTIEQRRRIHAELEDSYDRARARYCGMETDSTVAKRVGGVPIAWVAQVREMMFGASGENDEMDQLLAEIAKDRDALATLSAKALEIAAEAESAQKRLTGHAERVEAIRKAVGPKAARI